MTYERDSKGMFLKGGNVGKKHRLWKGDKVGYIAIHAWINRTVKKEKCCECGSIENLDYANISGEYKRNISDWQVMCKKHHHIFDNVYEKMMKTRAEKGSRFAKGNGLKYSCSECGLFGNHKYPKQGLCKKHYLKMYYQKNKLRYIK